MSFNNKDNQRGQILIEILIAVAIAAIVLFLGAQFIGVSLQGEESSRKRVVASQLIQEEFEALKPIAEDDWHNIDNKICEPQKYYLAESGGAWSFFTGTESMNLGNDSYVRWIIFNNVSRNGEGEIESVYNADHNDPSTRAVTVYVAYDSRTITGKYYLTRWKNRAEVQSDWTGYDENFTTTASGALQLKPQQ